MRYGRTLFTINMLVYMGFVTCLTAYAFIVEFTLPEHSEYNADYCPIIGHHINDSLREHYKQVTMATRSSSDYGLT